MVGSDESLCDVFPRGCPKPLNIDCETRSRIHWLTCGAMIAHFLQVKNHSKISSNISCCLIAPASSWVSQSLPSKTLETDAGACPNSCISPHSPQKSVPVLSNPHIIESWLAVAINHQVR